MFKIIKIKFLIVMFIILFYYSLEGKAESDIINNRINMFLSIDDKASANNLIEIIKVLNSDIINKDRVVDKVFYGYANVFMADIYNKNKSYSKAAETIKRAFFYIDESVESNKNKWTLIYLRLRMDAFVPSYLGRCNIAVEDSEKLLSSKDINPNLFIMIEYMYARALYSCKEYSKSKTIMNKVIKEGEIGKEIASYGYDRVPPWLNVEKILIIMPLMLEGY
ncbi:hypothetical protein [Providencia burhodogranariea]|uniref:Uncharacterized protein n=1 Tax=Providencia burhodogranariea DSM 19968 TaxID=1141662 RepID=K8WNZ9_9GAMM|nr:hypothetical protein [Providencia burhodogranariea]EKT62333.1 hypothetical protein OOA_08792 [Providencia burhodogranariea DSM 19968]